MSNTGQEIQEEIGKQIVLMDAPSADFSAFSRGYDPWLAGVMCSFGLLAWASWGKLGDLVLDVGHEVEIPARLLAGEMLYRDVQSNYGPFAYYANALALLLFGHHLEVFFAVGVALAGATTLLVYLLARRLTDGPWAALCAVQLQLCCIFSPRLFNLVFTYSYGSVYAIALSLGAFLCLAQYYTGGRSRWLVVAAVATGLACLSKQEYGVALAGCLLVGVNLAPGGWRRRLAASGLFLGVSSALVLGVLSWFALQVSWQTLASSLLPTGNFGNFAHSSLFQISPLKTIESWWSSLQEFLFQLLVVGGAMVGATAARRSLAKRLTATWVLSTVEVLIAVLLVAAGLAARILVSQPQTRGYFPLHPASLDWLLPALLIWSLTRGSRLPPLAWVLLVHAWLLNARWLFHIGFFELYSFSALLLFFVSLHWIARTTHLPLARYVLACLLVGAGFRLYQLSRYQYPVHSPYGTIYVREAARAAGFNRAIEILLALKPASLLVLPEGALLNFLTNTHSPAAEITFLPSVLPTVEAEGGFLARLRQNPPQVVVELYRPFPEWGYESYAQFNPLVHRWVIDEHHLLQRLPFDEGEIKIYQRIDPDI